MSENQMFENFGVEAEIRDGQNGRFAVWNLATLDFGSRGTVKITSITNESKTEDGNFGSLAAAVYRLTNGRPLSGTVRAIARRAVKNYTNDGVELRVNATIRGLANDYEVTRSTLVADGSRRNMQGAAYDLARQIFEDVGTNTYMYLNDQGWKPASQQGQDAEDTPEDQEALV